MKISMIMNVETSSICDNACQYCPAKDQAKHRPVGFMAMETFKRVMYWAELFIVRGTQREINLFGVGEPTLNPRIVEMVKYAREALGKRQLIHLNTNGNKFTEDLAWQLKDAGINTIDITGHDALATARTMRILKKVGIHGQVSFDFITSPNNWAGQVDWFDPDYSIPCPWIGRGQVMVMSNGDVTRCCIDAFGKGIVGSIWDEIDQIELTPFELCESCHHFIEG